MESQPTWENKQKTLCIGSKGMAQIHKQLMADLCAIIPQSKKETKVEKDKPIEYVKELTLLRSCNNTLYFEARKSELYLWVGKYPGGPSAKFLVNEIMTLDDTRFPGNCLKYSRPLLSFDSSFKESHLKVMEGLFIDAIGTPQFHPKSKPFIDHMLCFNFHQGRIYVRHFQIINNTESKFADDRVDTKKLSLMEIGPRFSLQPIKIFDDFLGGESLWINKHYITPSQIKRNVRKAVLEAEEEKHKEFNIES